MNKSGNIKLWAIVAWLIIWHIVSLLIGHSFILVSPWQVLVRGFELVQTSDFWLSVLNSTAKIAIGYIMAVAIGILFAGLASKYQRFREFISPLVLTIKTVPVVSFIILVLILLPSKSLSILISFLIAMPIVYTNVLEGISNTNREMLEIADVFDIRGMKRIRHIYLPDVYPHLRSAAMTACGMAWKAGAAAEVIGVPQGSIGEKLQRAKVYLETPDLFAWTIVIVVMSLLMEKLFIRIMDFIIVRGNAKRED